MPALPPASVIYLIIVFALRSFTDLRKIFRSQPSNDESSPSSHYSAWLQTAALWIGVALEIIALGCLIWPNSLTTTICLTSLLLSTARLLLPLETSLGSSRENYRQALIDNRELRGLPIPDEGLLEVLSSPTVRTFVLLLGMALIALFNWFLVSLVLNSQTYFDAFTRSL